MKKVIEYCSCCEQEVKINAVPCVLQRCPKCGAPIRACSLCDLNVVDCQECEKDRKEEWDF